MNLTELVGSHDILFITLDTLRYDVACAALAAGQTPNLARWLPEGQWEECHTPGSFTYAAHQAFFAGFLPTPAKPSPQVAARLFATRFAGSQTTTKDTLVFDTADIVSGLAGYGYHTICIGGVGFFNKQTPLGSVLPNLFSESHWSPRLGVTNPSSTQHQVELAIQRLNTFPASQRIFLFINVSALHSPNHIFLPNAYHDSPTTQVAALAYVDKHLGTLFEAVQKRAATITIICSDHGEAYGEEGFRGHRLAHSVVWTVPYTQFILPKTNEG
jgi:hypothetical protein